MTLRTDAYPSSGSSSAPTFVSSLVERLAPAAVRPIDARLATALKVTVGVVLLALLAQVRLQVGPVPITGQTLGVLLIGAGYGLSLGLTTVLAYLLLGAVGLPLFAGGASGLAYLAGPTGGYLVGFVLATALLGLFVRRAWDRSMASCAVAMLVASLAIYLPGLVWLKLYLGLEWAATIGVGLTPFLGGDIIKLVIAAVALPGAWRLLGHKPS